MEDNGFKYTYSAKEQEEVKKIREKYAAPSESGIDKMEKLRRLDNGVTQKGTMASLVVGIIGALILGMGMSLAMVFNEFVLGILIGVLGIIGVCFAYPIYIYIIKREREKIAPEILKLTDELMK